jgi:hypothetical protein
MVALGLTLGQASPRRASEPTRSELGTCSHARYVTIALSGTPPSCSSSFVEVVNHAAFSSSPRELRICPKSVLSLLPSLLYPDLPAEIVELAVGKGCYVELIDLLFRRCILRPIIPGTYLWKRNCRKPIFPICVWMLAAIGALWSKLWLQDNIWIDRVPQFFEIPVQRVTKKLWSILPEVLYLESARELKVP